MPRLRNPQGGSIVNVPAELAERLTGFQPVTEPAADKKPAEPAKKAAPRRPAKSAK